MSGTIRRAKRKNNFSLINNEIFENKDLSIDSVGLLVYLLSKPDDWHVRNKQLMNHWRIGETKLKRIMKELKNAGYVTRQRRHENGRFTWETIVYDEAQTITMGRKQPDCTMGSKTIDRKTIDRKQPDIVSTENTNTEYTNTEKDKSAREFERFVDFWGKALPDKPKPRKTTKSVKKKFETRCKDDGFLDSYEQALIRASKSDFLMNRWQGFDYNWFLKNDTNWLKVFQGKYDNNGRSSNAPVVVGAGERTGGAL